MAERRSESGAELYAVRVSASTRAFWIFYANEFDGED